MSSTSSSNKSGEKPQLPRKSGKKPQLPRDIIFKAGEEEEIIKWVDDQNKDSGEDDVQTTGKNPLGSVEPTAKQMRLSPSAAGGLSSSSRSRLREISNEYSTREPVNQQAQMLLYKEKQQDLHELHTNCTNFLDQNFQQECKRLESEITSKFHVFVISPGSNWSAVMPLAQAPSVLRYSAIPHKEMLFFFDSVKNEAHLNIPDNALKESDAAVVKMLVENPLMLCLNDEMLTFLLDLPTTLKNPFVYLKNNQAEEEDAIIMDFFHNKDEECQTRNYLLLDPRCFDKDKIDETSFFDFLRSIFYIGRGKGCRPFDHMQKVVGIYMYGGIKEIMQTFGESYKKGRIHDIFAANRGVVILSLFQNVMELESEWREHCMLLARHDYAWSRLEKCPYWPNIILGPLSLTNKDEGEIDKLKPNPRLCNDSLNTMLGCQMLLHAFGQFKHARLEEQYSTNFEVPASALALDNIKRFFASQLTPPSNPCPWSPAVAAADEEEEEEEP